MYSLNRATVIGNLTRDPELRYTPNGQAVTSFSVATNRRWKNQATNEWQEATEYHDIVAWGKSAEFITNFLKKGNKIYVDGRLQTRGWETPDGVKQRRTEIIIENFVPLTPKPGGGMHEGFDAADSSGAMASAAGAAMGAAADSQNAPEMPIQAHPTEAAASTTKPAGKSTPAAKDSAKDNAKPAAEDEINLEDIPF